MTPPVVAVSSVARAAPRVRGRLARHGDELPGVGPITQRELQHAVYARNAHLAVGDRRAEGVSTRSPRSEEHTSELQSPCNLVCRLLLEKKKTKIIASARRSTKNLATFDLRRILSYMIRIHYVAGDFLIDLQAYSNSHLYREF